MNTELIRRADGTLTNFSRHDIVNGKRGQGGLVVYEGEAKEVMEMILKYSNRSTDGSSDGK